MKVVEGGGKDWEVDHPGGENTITGRRRPSHGGEYYHREGEGVEVCQGGIVPQTTPRAGGGKTGPGTWEVEERRSCVGPAGTLSLCLGTSHE